MVYFYTQNSSPLSYFANKICFAERGNLVQHCPKNTHYYWVIFLRLAYPGSQEIWHLMCWTSSSRTM